MESSKHILVVEDETLIASALQRKLESAGFQVTVAGDGESGLQKALDVKPDLILLDIILPKMDGMTVLDKLREDQWGAMVPVIILTNLDTDREFERSKQKGVNDFLVKTNWTLDDVLKKVNERLNES